MGGPFDMIPEGQTSRGAPRAHRGTIEPVHLLRRLRRRLLAVVATVAGGVAVAALAGPAAAHGPVPDAPPDAANLLLGWNIDPLIALPLIVAGIAWWRLLGAIDRAHPDHPVPAAQRWSFVAGLFVIAVALMSGIERYDTTLFSLHMVQHLLLAMVAPPLLALGAPITQVLRASSASTRQRVVLPILHSRVLGVLGHPIVAWILFAGAMWGTHFSPVFDLSLENRSIHDLEHVLYLASGLLFWWPAVGLDPAPHRMGHAARLGYLFLQMPQNSFLAVAILFADAPLYPHYVTLYSPYGIDALSDQRLAAGIMWFVGDVIFLVALLAVMAGWMRYDSRDSEAADRRADVERAAIRDREELLRRRLGTSARGRPQARAAGPAADGQSGSRASISDR